jgi:hypothetical protein
VIAALILAQQDSGAVITAWAPIAVAVLSFAAAAYATHQTRQVERRKVEGEAFDRAQRITDAAITRLEGDLQRASAELDKLREENHQLRLQLARTGMDLSGD